MRDMGIVFSREMIIGMFEHRKTMTRRLAWFEQKPFKSRKSNRDYSGSKRASDWQRVQPGDRLWVREIYWQPYKESEKNNGCVYLADYGYKLGLIGHDEAKRAWASHWIVARFMPRRASRFTLTVTANKIEALQAISDKDAILEGAHQIEGNTGWTMGNGQFAPTPQEAFAGFFKLLHGPKVWDENPEVCAISFTVEEGNIGPASWEDR